MIEERKDFYMNEVEVVAAIIIKDDKILCTQKSKDDKYLALKWEFPGGKIEKGETHQEALKREIKEELNIDIKVTDFYMSIIHSYNTFHIKLYTYLCEMKNKTITLNEHRNYKWLGKEDLKSLDWLDADVSIAKNIIMTANFI
jgi:8-oxo-dGTP diphosphatase